MHNIAYLMTLMRSMRAAIMSGEEAYGTFVRRFLKTQFPTGELPLWVTQAMQSANIPMDS